MYESFVVCIGEKEPHILNWKVTDSLALVKFTNGICMRRIDKVNFFVFYSLFFLFSVTLIVYRGLIWLYMMFSVHFSLLHMFISCCILGCTSVYIFLCDRYCLFLACLVEVLQFLSNHWGIVKVKYQLLFWTHEYWLPWIIRYAWTFSSSKYE